MKKLLILFISLISVQLYAQELTGTQLLDKAIQYHDPNGNWKYFNGVLFVTMETPKSPNRDSEIKIDLPNEYFYLKMVRGKHETELTINKEECILLNDGRVPTKEEKERYKLSCGRANMYKNYYTYLYGLPMKLKDNGTIIHDKVERKTFKGKEYLVLKVTYDEKIGSDIWYFYFNPKTYAMEVYQFFKEKPNSGEYILLSDEVIVNGIKMPKNRAWYYNKNDGYLGTDILKN